MKLVIDSNQLRAPRPPKESLLRKFLAASPRNFAVLTDYAAMEAYKSSAPGGVHRSMDVLGEFPNQVLVLKGTNAVCGLRGRNAGLQRRLIHEGQTFGFAKFVSDLKRAEAGDRRYVSKVQEHRQEALKHFARLTTDAQKMGEAIRRVSTLYSKEDLRAVREMDVYPPGFVEKAIEQIIVMATFAFVDHPMVRVRPPTDELPNTFIFRMSLCAHVLALDWAAKGGAQDASPEKLCNDIVDVNFAAFATYFDGLLTDDGKASRIHAQARLLLTAVFGAELPSGWEGADIKALAS